MWNRPVGWSSVAVGIALGLVMGLWSFDGPLAPPAWIGGYGDTSRRLLRLGHIAFIALGLIGVLVETELAQSALTRRARLRASHLMIAGNVLLPTALCLAALWRPFKYLMPLPALCVLAALVMVAWGAVKNSELGAWKSELKSSSREAER
jgi:hypothetical protein